MSIFETKAQEVANDLIEKEGLKDKQVIESESFILIIVALLKILLPLLISCIPASKRSDPKVILESVKSLGPLQKWMLRKKIKDMLGDSVAIFVLADPLDRQIRSMVSKCTEQDFVLALNDLS